MQAELSTDEQYRALSKKLINTIEGHFRIMPLNN